MDLHEPLVTTATPARRWQTARKKVSAASLLLQLGTGSMYEASVRSRMVLSQRCSTKHMEPSPALTGAGTSWKEVALTIANALVGAGMLSLPFALKTCGWAGLLVIVAASWIASITAKSLAWSMETLNLRSGGAAVTTYDGLAEAIAGRAGDIAMKLLTVLELGGGIICFIVLHSINWPVLLRLPPLVCGLPAKTVSALAMCCCLLPLLLVQQRHLAVFAVVGLASTAGLFAVTLVAPLLAGLPPPIASECAVLDESILPGTLMERHLLIADGLGASTGVILFAFAGHATFPELYKQMSADEKPNFSRACDVGFCGAVVLYVVFAALGYFFLGDCVADSVTLNLMSVSAPLGGAATTLILINTFVSISILAVPVIRIVAAEEDEPAAGVLIKLRPKAVGTRVALVAVGGACAVMIPNFAFVVSLIGSVCTMMISFILPATFYLSIHPDSPLAARLLYSAIVLVGFLGMFLGVRSALSAATE